MVRISRIPNLGSRISLHAWPAILSFGFLPTLYPQNQPSFSVEVDVVPIIVTVRDDDGHLVTDLRKEDFILEEEGNLQEILLEIMSTKERINLLEMVREKRDTNEPHIIVFVGINGTGKTTSIAKVAKLLMKRGYSVVLACSDTYRAGSIEQLEEHARRLGVRMIKHKYGADPAAVAYDAISHGKAHGVDAVLIDTAGRIQTDKNLMNELAKIKRIISPDLTILTVDALTGNDAVMQAEEFHKSVGIDGTILTKVDADVKGGSALSVTYVTGKPILFIGIGQRYEDLQEFSPEQFAKMILK